MADGLPERGTFYYDAVTRGPTGEGTNNTVSTELKWLEIDPPLQLDEKPLPYFLVEYGSDAKNPVIKLTARTFNRVFGNQTDDDLDERRSKEAELGVAYEAKFFGLKFTRLRKYAVRPTKGAASEVNFRDGPKDDFVSTIRISPKIQESLRNHKITTDGLVWLTIKQRHYNVLWGAFGLHPRYDVNLGWLFAHISIIVSIVFYVIGLISEAFKASDWIHDQAIDGWLSSRAQRRRHAHRSRHSRARPGPHEAV